MDFTIDIWSYWSGRWVSHFLEALLLSNIDLTGYGYGLAVLVILLAGIACVGAFVRTLLPAGMAWVVALALMVMFLTRDPHVDETVYWLTGAIEYLLGPGVSLLTVAVAFSRAPWLAPVLGFLAGGMHQFAGGLLASMLVVLFALFPARRTVLAVVLLATLVGLGVNIGAPGNAMRASGLPPYPGTPRVLTVIVQNFTSRLRYWCLDGSLVFGVLALWNSSAFQKGCRYPWPRWALWLVPAGWLTTIVGAMAAVTFVIYYVPERVLSFTYLVFLLGCLTTLVVWRGAVESKEARFARVFPVLWAVALLLGGNVSTSTNELRERVPEFRQATLARYVRLQSDPSPIVSVRPLPPVPGLYFDLDVLEDRRDHRNVCMAAYFGRAAVVLEP